MSLNTTVGLRGIPVRTGIVQRDVVADNYEQMDKHKQAQDQAHL